MELRRWLMTLGAGVLLVSACQRSEQDRARAERKDVAEAQKDVREEQRDLSKEQRESQRDAAQATQGEREDVAEAKKEERKESGEAARAEQQAAGMAGSVNGRVVRSSSDELVIRPSGEGSDVRLKVGSDTRVTADGQRASMDQLREGAQVRASFSEEDGERKATKIELEK